MAKSKALTLIASLFLLSSIAQAEPVCVKVPKANLRSGPGNKHAVTWTVSQNMPLMRLESKNGWSQVQDLDGNKHWVPSKAVSARISCAVVKTKTAKLRKGPGSSKPEAELAVAERYTPFRKLDRDGAWLLVQDEYSGKYWVNETNVWIPMMRASFTF
ncbi:MAG TPA: SH3 domain-containing protein [Bdellovibrionales bacterium]|nr:SH3 domain-containing protein [Bdellovibrionales bacterium]